MLLYALSTGYKIGLGLVAGMFIVLALLAALVIPRSRPEFPGRRLRLFLLAAAAMTVGMLAAVVVLGREAKEKKAEAATSSVTATTAPPPAAAGDPVAGKKLFSSKGCNACHTFAPAGSHGTVGPNLDKLAADALKANRGTLDQYTRESIASPDAYTVPGFPKGVMRVSIGPLTDRQISDLVAFLTQK